MKFIKRLFNIPERSFFLLGPRGMGKSTLLRSECPEALWIDLLAPEVLRKLLARPEELENITHANPNQKIVVIDEIQKAPALLSVVHKLIEEKRDLQFILTGSSARKLKRTSANLLGGRALKKALHPFMAAELGSEFSLPYALQNGTIPLLYKEKDPQTILHGYVNLYLQEEIYSEGLVRNLENFSRFLEVITFSHASLLNVSNIARDCEVKRKSVENYIDILEELLLCFRLPIFSKRAERELSSHPKFYLFDAGIFYALRPKGPLDRVEEINGLALEGLIAQHLRAWNDYSAEKHTLNFWRTRSGLEVDFIVYGPNNFWAIEVKNSDKIGIHDTKSLEEFLKDYPMAKAILLYRGKQRIKYNNILCIPCEEFLLQLKPDHPLFSDYA